jgi:hypothetical protein
MADDPIARIKQLDQERAQLITKGKKEALERANTAIDDLSVMGFNYKLIEQGNNGRSSTLRGKRQVKDTPCPICKFKTAPPHDARKHRGQGKRKVPFTSAELKMLALEKV